MANMLKTATMTLFFIGLLLVIIYSEKDGKDTVFLGTDNGAKGQV
jgi:hypothetical protein